MIAPLSWLKEYVNITLDPKTLGERLTEVGLGTEKITKVGSDTIFELEITPNRPDWYSIIGVAHEIAVIENTTVKYPKIKVDLSQHKKTLPLEIKTDADINPRFTGIIIDGVTVKESPQWLKERLIKIGLRPINNIVDITNYVMFELGNPLHAFDYDKIKGHTMTVEQAKGGEVFKSVDGISYHLPKGAVIIKDEKDIIDLCGIKGGYNSGTFAQTKTIFLRVPVEDPVLIRKASLALGLRSEASSIFEKKVNAGGTIEALRRCVDLIQELAGGEIASKLYDLKKEDFAPWKVKVRISRIQYILGIAIKETEIIKLLKRLNLQTEKINEDTLVVTIPTYRNDLHIEEDLIEEVARVYGYNNFPKTLPVGQIPTITIPYYKDYSTEEKIKQSMKASEFSEVYTYSLISENDLINVGLNIDNVIRVDNPVSRDFEYLRPTLKINLLKALKQNKAYSQTINLFELGKVYTGKNLKEASEHYELSGITNTKSYAQVKGILERLFRELKRDEDPTNYIEILDEGIFFSCNITEILAKPEQPIIYKPIAKFPPMMEDIAFIFEKEAKIGDIIKIIQKQNKLINKVTLLDIYGDTKTFHIVYQHPEKNLTKEDIKPVRENIVKELKNKFNAVLRS